MSLNRFTNMTAHDRGDIARVLTALITSPGIEIDDLPIYLDALRRFAKVKIHFVDSTIAATGAARSLSVASFDSDFTKFLDVVANLD